MGESLSPMAESRALQGAELTKDSGDAEEFGGPLLIMTESIMANSKSDASSKKEHAFFRFPIEEMGGVEGKLTFEIE